MIDGKPRVFLVGAGPGNAGLLTLRAVECLAQGNRAALEELLEALRGGPGSAEVQQVETDWRPAKDDLNGFQVVG